MTKEEEVLLELVLDNFSNIKEVLNATKDIENFLIKLKLNKKRGGIGVIFEKVKNLVDSLYDHSVKVRDEFYKQFNNLESFPIEKDNSRENSITDDENDVDTVGENNTIIEDNGEPLLNTKNVEEKGNKSTDNEQELNKTPNIEVTESNDVDDDSDVTLDNIDITATENVDVDPKSPIRDVEDEPLSLEKDKQVTNDVEKSNDAKTDISSDDPLKIGDGNPDIETNVDDTTSKSDNENEKEPVSEAQDAVPVETKFKKEPRIRLVDLSKLIDPKPKKSVKFDSSIIILTSSDEDSNTPKRKSDVKDLNGKLKPALKPSLNKNICNEYRNNEDLSSSNKERTKKIKQRRKSEMKDINSDSDNEVQSEKRDKKRVEKTNKKGKENSSNDEESDDEPSKKKKKTSKIKEKSKKDNSDSSDYVIQESSDTEIKKQSESPGPHSSRKSTRVCIQQNQKQKRKEKLKTLFKRRSSKHGTSRFEIVNKKSSNCDSDSDSDNNQKEQSRKKKDLVEQHLSDSSSFSDDENEDIEENVLKKSKKTKKRKHKGDLSSSPEDKKFTYKVYIPLPRIKCERLREIYMKNKDILEIKRLTKIDLPKSSKRHRKNKNDSNSSSDTEKPISKKSKRVPSEEDVVGVQSSDDEPLTDLAKKVAEEKRDPVGLHPEKPVENENDDEIMADIVMDKMQSSDIEEKLSEGSNDSEPDNEEKKKSKENIKEKASENNPNEIDKHDKNETIEKDDDKNEEVENKDEDTKSDSGEANNEQPEDDKDKDDNDKVENKDESTKSKDDEANEKKDEDGEKNGDDTSCDASDVEKKNKKKKWRSDKLLTTQIDSTDSDEDFSKYNKKKEKSLEELMSDDEIRVPITTKRKMKKRNKKVIICDSDESNNDKSDNEKSNGESSDESKKSTGKSSSNSEEEKEVKKKPARRRIKRTKDSSSSSDEDKSTRKHIRKVIGKDALSETTKQAEAEEKERKARIAEKQKKYNQIYENITESNVEKVVLDYDDKEKKELLTVHKGLVKKLKPHQASGIQFMWDACFESLERTKDGKGSGCILAHCMGLGKTLQVIALAHTLLTNGKLTGVEKIMVVCPVNTVLNWKAEFKKWIPKSSQVDVYELVSCKQNYERQYTIQEWHNDGGILIIGYTMFRNLSNPDNKRISKKMRQAFQEGLVDPGPDLVVCDEGHLLKNEKTNLSIAMNRIKTLRRIVLTGTPLQNNLKEYWCMVQFIKPNLLGTYKEYLNRFVNPITNGQYTDSTQHDIILMRKRSHVLHKLLDGVVQRRDYSVLEPYLPPKHEYVLFVSLTETQTKLYTHYMDQFARKSDGSNKTSFLFTDFQQLQRICTHPRVLLDKSKEKKEKDIDTDSEGSLRDFIDDGDDGEPSGTSSNSSSSKSSSGSDGSDDERKKKNTKTQQKTRVTRAQAALRRENNEESDSEVEEVAQKEWWQEYCDGDELDNINNSGKLFLLFQILKECEEIGDKVLVFSQSLYTLNCIEYFLQKIDEATQDGNTQKVGGHSGSWSLGLDYFRLDGSSSCDNRATWCDSFNNPDNTRARLFLISTKAGGLGINLVAANRVIIFDVSWNPSHDIQSIYRVYRFGQTKPCYIYRFVSYGTMEMKIYERQVTKQAISKRVIDEQQIDRHYNQNDLQELYKCDLEPTDRPIPLVPKDVLLGELLQKYEKTIFKYHLHQSLLENKTDEGLNEEERKAAWEEFENEKVLRKNTSTSFFNNYSMNAHAIAAALASIVRKDNPTWSDVQIKGIIPALVQQLQVQLAEGDLTMYARVQKEMQLMQALQAQKMKEAYYQQQVMRMIQQQQQQAKILGNLQVDPVQLARSQANLFNNHLANVVGGPSSAPRQPMSNDVIELND